MAVINSRGFGIAQMQVQENELLCALVETCSQMMARSEVGGGD